MSKPIDILNSLGIPPLPSQSSDSITALLWAREVVQKHIATTYAVQNPKGIEELKSVNIGGVNQWLHIRGRNRNNPVLLYLHGGAGNPAIGFMDAIQRPWEDYFTVVHWDQRQTGKSYYAADDANNPLTIDQFIKDTEEVIEYLLHYLKQERLCVLGHSWGSVLGMHMVKRHPEWLYAYVGVGQVVSLLGSEQIIYQRLLEHATKAKNEQALIAKLESIAPYPNPDCPEKSFVEHCGFVRQELSRLAGETLMHHVKWDDAIRMLTFEKTVSPHLTLTDISNTIFGDDLALLREPYQFTKEFMDINLPQQLGSAFDVPIFFFTGRHDYQTPITLSDQWFSEIEAPNKALIHFEESSHFVVNEEPGRVLNALVNEVLPCTQAKLSKAHVQTG